MEALVRIGLAPDSCELFVSERNKEGLLEQIPKYSRPRSSIKLLAGRLRRLPFLQTCAVYIFDKEALPPTLPHCRNLEVFYEACSPGVDFPRSILSIHGLESVEISSSCTFKSIPPRLRVKTLIATCLQAPYWLVDADMTLLLVYVQGSLDWMHVLRNLRRLILQGLQAEGMWKQWLTKGLYDPRVFLLVRDFLL